MMELFIFYSYICNAILFLFYIQMRGLLGYMDEYANVNRYVFDALDYYEIDLEWTSFQFVPIGLCMSASAYLAHSDRNRQKFDHLIMLLIVLGRVV